MTETVKLKIIVTDDEQNVRQVIIQLLNRFFKQNIILIEEAENIAQAHELLIANKHDLVLLDIEMPGGNGFQLLEKFTNPEFDVIFITSYDQYAIKAIKYSALDYLMKPLSSGEFRSAIEKAIGRKRSEINRKVELSALKENLSIPSSSKKIILNHKTKLDYVYEDEILWMEGEINYTHIYLTNGKIIHISKTLKDFEELLCSSDTVFLRIHKTFIVNLKHATEFNTIESKIKLSSGKYVDVSRRKKNEVILSLKKMKGDFF
jgi:two-component system LytT family response regulator